MAHIPQMLAPKLTATERDALKTYGRQLGGANEGDVTALVQLRLLERDSRTAAYHLTDLGKAVFDEINRLERV